MTSTETPAKDQSLEPPGKIPRYKDAGQIVHSRISRLQKQLFSSGHEAQARASLAALRQAVSQSPGESFEIWELTHVEKTPDWATDAPTPEEMAVHTAMTLYALHQQSRTSLMSRPGIGLGRAARDLVGRDAEDNESLRKRFNALVTSSTITELRHHLRTFITLLRSKEIALDHAMLADDVARFQRPGGPATVRLRWARQYYSVPAPGAGPRSTTGINAPSGIDAPSAPTTTHSTEA